jgi:metacaspase-1
MERRKALCVGINKFKNFPEAALRGCVNDARDMSSILCKYYGFKKEDVTVLTDAMATKKNIMTNLNKMVAGAQAGKYDYLVFSFSSHGTQIPDAGGDEKDMADEAFCPHDLKQKQDDWDPRYIISDDELHDLFAQVPDNVLLEVYLDTCHSGTGLKAVDLHWTRQPRYLPPPSLSMFMQLLANDHRSLRSLLLEDDKPNHILWAACRDNQTSADALIDGKWHGAFTHYFCRELTTANGDIVRRDLLKKVKVRLAENDYSQVPQLEYKATLRKK